MITLKKHFAGFTLVELVIFIVILGIIVSGVFLAFSTALQQSSNVNPQTTANELASARMDIILGQRRMNGFATLVDPCPAAAVCPAMSGYTTTSTIAALTIGADSNYKLITVTVTGPQNATAEVKTFVAYYP